jgi:hypothetical protein
MDGDSISDSRMAASKHGPARLSDLEHTAIARHGQVIVDLPCISRAARRLIVARAVLSRIAAETTRASLITCFSYPSFSGKIELLNQNNAGFDGRDCKGECKCFNVVA